MIRFMVLGLGILSVTACSWISGSSDKSKFVYVEQPVEQLYLLGVNQLERKRVTTAIQYFEEVERQHPYSPWARRSILMSAYAHYSASNFEDAIANLDRFLATHPGNKNADYAFYLKAICYYERIRDVGRDQDITLNAVAALRDVIRRYPDTDYARDAKLKLDLTYDQLAGREMNVGRFYLRRDHHIAAINRFNTVLKEYQTTTHAAEALHRIVEAYLQMGVIPEARRHAAILGHNYPGNPWYRDTYKLFAANNLLLASDSAPAASPSAASQPAASQPVLSQSALSQPALSQPELSRSPLSLAKKAEGR